MPFVIRKVEPRYVSRGHVPQGSAAQGLPVGAELEAVANGALTTSLKQLASLIANAEEIFAELTAEMTSLADRSGLLRHRIDRVQNKLATIDPKKIPVPESDICTFASRTEHFQMKNILTTSLFKLDSRPKALQELYDAAAIVAVKSLDSLRRGRDGSSMDLFMCTPVLSKRRRDKSLDIESRVPAAIEDLRRWTSAEALGDVTVPPDCMSRILADSTNGTAVDHKLPSPEEQVQAIAMKFPAEVVAVDVSGRRFDRMSMRRRSLLSRAEPSDAQDATVKRRSRPRRPRGKRRNTIAGTDQKEIRQAIGNETTGAETEETLASDATRAHRSASTDLLESKKDSPTDKKSHFNTLKSWGMSRLKFISPKSTQSIQQAMVNGSGSWTEERSTQPASKADDINIYETVSNKRKRDKSHERKPSSSSSSGKSTSSIPVSAANMDNKQTSVKLRESAVQRRERRKGNKEDQPHSSSGNWSASSESGRASIGSETTTTTHPPRSTTTASIGTSSTSLNHIRRFKGRDTSASSSVTSEGTLTPDIIQDITVIPFSDDGETSSVYSCDTEGYYTSFHMDSGLKTLREEELVPVSPLTKSNDVNSDPTSPVVENEYELFGRGSTSTTTSSAGTVCTALLAPPPPERKSSLTVVAMIHSQNQNGGESPDSGHNTSSSPVDSASSPACTGRSCSEFEYSESSDLEGCDRIERIRSKTAINVSRIPSMCIITPPGSDDEHQKEHDNDKKRNNHKLKQAGAVVMSATVGTSKMEVINGQDKNLYATVQTVPQNSNEKVNSHSKISPLSGVLEKLRGVLPLQTKKHQKTNCEQPKTVLDELHDSGDYVTIADVRNNNDKRRPGGSTATYANADLFKKDAEYVSLSELPKKPDSSLERRRQGARVTLDSEGKVVYSSDSLKRRKGAHTTFNPGPFVKTGTSPTASPIVHRAQANVRAVKTQDVVDSASKSTPPTSPRPGKLIIRATKSPERANNQDYIRTVSTVVGPTSPTSPQKQVRGAYVNMQEDEDNAFLAISGDSIPVQAIGQSPSYILPSHDSRNHQHDCKCRPIEQQKSQNDQKNYCQKQQAYQHQQSYIDVLQNARNPAYLDPNRVKTYDENQKNARHNAKLEQQYLNRTRVPSHQFYTLPSRKLDKEVEPPRSVTPDITRGLNRGPLSAMHLLARQQSTIDMVAQRPYVITNEHLNGNISRVPNLPQQMDVRNRFFASSLTYNPEKKTDVQVSFSPIRPENSTGFKSSTPVRNSSLDRLNVSDTRSSSPVTSANGHPANIILSPSKSTMSNEELFAAIHKSKKRLNIKDDSENLSSGSAAELLSTQSGTRHSWSPESYKTPEIPQTIQPTSTTSRMDFKRLLLQQSVKSGPVRISAAEQLKMSRQQNHVQQSAAPTNYQQPSLTKVMSPRSAWRFQTPRTDVLSSTIVEDAAAEEKAMKLSPDPVGPKVQNRLDQLSNEKVNLAKNVQNVIPMDSPKSSLGTRAPVTNVQNNVTLKIYKPMYAQTPAQSASENRRKSVQLARAQFLASAPVDPQTKRTCFLEKRFRARSESPQHATTQQVARSPSAPTLETAL